MNWYDKEFPKDREHDRPGCWITWLAETDDEEALLYRHKEQMKQKAKTVRAAYFYFYEEGSVEWKKAKLEQEQDVKDADLEYFSAEQSWRELHNKRKTVETAFDAWRTREASRRATVKGV